MTLPALLQQDLRYCGQQQLESFYDLTQLQTALDSDRWKELTRAVRNRQRRCKKTEEEKETRTTTTYCSSSKKNEKGGAERQQDTVENGD